MDYSAFQQPMGCAYNSWGVYHNDSIPFCFVYAFFKILPKQGVLIYSYSILQPIIIIRIGRCSTALIKGMGAGVISLCENYQAASMSYNMRKIIKKVFKFPNFYVII